MNSLLQRLDHKLDFLMLGVPFDDTWVEFSISPSIVLFPGFTFESIKARQHGGNVVYLIEHFPIPVKENESTASIETDLMQRRTDQSSGQHGDVTRRMNLQVKITDVSHTDTDMKCKLVVIQSYFYEGNMLHDRNYNSYLKEDVYHITATRS